MYKQFDNKPVYKRRSTDREVFKIESKKCEFKQFFSDEKTLTGFISEDRDTVIASCSKLIKHIKFEQQLFSTKETLHKEIEYILLNEQLLSACDFIGTARCDTPLNKENKLILLDFLADIGRKDILKEVALHSQDSDIAHTCVWGLYRLGDTYGLYEVAEKGALNSTKRCAERALYKIEQKF